MVSLCCGAFLSNVLKMKKKYRNIVVDNITYTWASGHNNCDGDGSNLLTVWKNKKPFLRELINGNIEITPALVKEKINNYEQYKKTI